MNNRTFTLNTAKITLDDFELSKQIDTKFFSPLDPLLEEKEQVLVAKKINFPLPNSPDTLETFLTQDQKRDPNNNLQDGPYHDGVSKLITELKTWANNSQVSPTIIEKATKTLKSYLYDYSGSSEDVNRTRFPLYKEGIPLIAKILILLEDKELSLTFKQDAIKNLFENLYACEPGIHTYLFNAYLNLAAFKNINLEWKKIRKQIAEQVILDEIKNHSAIPTGMIVHYVNGVLNWVNLTGDALSIEAIPDENIRFCNKKILDTLANHFIHHFKEHFTPEKIIDLIILNNFKQQEVQSILSNKPEKIKPLLNRFGDDITFNAPLYLLDPQAVENDEMVVIDEDRVYPVSKDYNFQLATTLFIRLLNKGYFNSTFSNTKLIEQSFAKALNLNLDNLFLVPDYLNFCYEIRKNAYGQNERIAFLDYCSTILTDENLANQHPELIGCLDSYLTDKNRTYLIKKLFLNTLQKNNMQPLMAEKMQFLIQTTKKINPEVDAAILEYLPLIDRKLLLTTIDKFSLSSLPLTTLFSLCPHSEEIVIRKLSSKALIDSISNLSEFTDLLEKHLSQKKGEYLLEQLGVENLSKLFKKLLSEENKHQTLLDFLKRCANYMPFMHKLGLFEPTILNQFIAHGDSFMAILAIMKTDLKIMIDKDFIKKLGMNWLKQLLNEASQWSEIVYSLNKDDSKKYVLKQLLVDNWLFTHLIKSGSDLDLLLKSFNSSAELYESLLDGAIKNISVNDLIAYLPQMEPGINRKNFYNAVKNQLVSEIGNILKDKDKNVQNVKLNCLFKARELYEIGLSEYKNHLEQVTSSPSSQKNESRKLKADLLTKLLEEVKSRDSIAMTTQRVAELILKIGKLIEEGKLNKTRKLDLFCIGVLKTLGELKKINFENDFNFGQSPTSLFFTDNHQRKENIIWRNETFYAVANDTAAAAAVLKNTKHQYIVRYSDRKSEYYLCFIGSDGALKQTKIPYLLTKERFQEFIKASEETYQTPNLTPFNALSVAPTI